MCVAPDITYEMLAFLIETPIVLIVEMSTPPGPFISQIPLPFKNINHYWKVVRAYCRNISHLGAHKNIIPASGA